MNKRKIFAWLAGISSAIALIIGLICLFSSETVSFASGIVVICLSLASGLIIPNPISLVCLIAGICMLIFPARIVGIILMLIGLGGGLANWLVWRRKAGNARFSAAA